MKDLQALAAAVGHLCRLMRPQVMTAFQEPPRDEERKADGTIVTALDLELEERFFEGLDTLEPGLGFVGEEGGRRRDGELSWHVDPLDGTLNFSRRSPQFAMQVALIDGKRPRVGVIYDPVSDSLTWATEGGGAWRDGERVHVSARSLDEIVLLADISRSGHFLKDPTTLPRLRRFVFRMRSLGSVALHLRDVACGIAEAYVASRAWESQPYDFAPGVLLVREAGGLATSLEGADPFEDSRTLLAAAPEVHAALRRVLET